MATLVTRQQSVRRERVFFCAMSALILATVLLGFARTYFLAGMMRAPLPNALIHVHGAAFTAWIVLLIVQTALISVRRVAWHRRLGLAGFGLALLMVVLGVLAGTNSLQRGFSPLGSGLDARTFYVVPMTDMLLFSVLIFWSYRSRFDAPTHKRLVLLGTIALLDAAVGRWPFAVLLRNPQLQDLVVLSFVVALIGFDLWTRRRVHRVTMWGAALIVVVHQLRIPLGMSAPWLTFAEHVRRIG